MRLYLNPNFSTQNDIFKCLSKGVLFDPELSKVIAAPLEPGDAFYDVGAHVGYYSALAAQKIGESGFVTAWEPNPQTAVNLWRLLAGTGWLTIAKAVGDTIGVASMTINTRDEGMSSLDNRPIGMPSITVPTCTLDTFENRFVRMMKIDVEGHELQVLRGSERRIRAGQFESIIFEHNDMLGLPRGKDIECRRFLAPLGYKFYVIPHANWRWPEAIRKTGVDDPMPHTYCNVLCTLRDDFEDVIKNAKPLSVPEYEVVK